MSGIVGGGHVTGGSSSTSALATTGATVDVAAAAPPTAGQVLTAEDATHATWQTPAGGGGRFSQVITLQSGWSSPRNVALGEDGALFVLEQIGILNLPNATAYPVGFRFAIALNTSGDPSIEANSGVIYDENGNQTGTYGSTGGNVGFFLELTLIASGKWVVTGKSGVWSAT